MNDVRRPILVYGATGRQGGAVVKALVHARWPVRAVVRDPMLPTSTLLRDLGVDVRRGSFTDRETTLEAMKGVHGVFSVLPGTLARDEEVGAGVMIADAAAKSGVTHFVYSSGASVGSKPTGIARFDAKMEIEAHVRSLPLVSTIIKPMIFMDMLLNPAFGLDTGTYTFLLQPEQKMQVVAVEDIGKVVAAVFSDKSRFGGKTIKIASDTITGNSLQTILSEASGRTIAYSRLADEVLAANPDLDQIAISLERGPLAEHVDLNLMREINPEIASLRSWLRGAGREKLRKAMRY